MRPEWVPKPVHEAYSTAKSAQARYEVIILHVEQEGKDMLEHARTWALRILNAENCGEPYEPILAALGNQPQHIQDQVGAFLERWKAVA